MNLQEELKALKERIAELEELEKQEQEFPQDGDEYWYLDTTGDICNENWECFSFEKATLEIGNVFKTKEQAEFAVEKLKVEAELRKYSRPFKEDDNNYFIEIDHLEDKLLSLDSSKYFQTQGTIYFESTTIANEAIDAIGENRIKKYIFGVEE